MPSYIHIYIYLGFNACSSPHAIRFWSIPYISPQHKMLEMFACFLSNTGTLITQRYTPAFSLSPAASQGFVGVAGIGRHPVSCVYFGIAQARDGGHLKPVTLKPVIRIFRIFRVFASAFSAFSVFSAFLLCGVSSNPCFFRMRGGFRIFAVSGSNR